MDKIYNSSLDSISCIWAHIVISLKILSKTWYLYNWKYVKPSNMGYEPFKILCKQQKNSMPRKWKEKNIRYDNWYNVIKKY